MFEKVNPYHPDKVADRIAGAIVDLAYTRATGGWANSNPRIAVEVLLGHGMATVMIETSLSRQELGAKDVVETVMRICPDIKSEKSVFSLFAAQDSHLADNQRTPAAGDNGIFKGLCITPEEKRLTAIAHSIADRWPHDGKYIIMPDEYVMGNSLVICQSHMSNDQASELEKLIVDSHPYFKDVVVNPLGEWTGGINVDCGATNRKLGSDMGFAATGGGLHGKDLSKADVCVNIVCHILAQKYGQVQASCSIGQTFIPFRDADDFDITTYPFDEVMEMARLYILTEHGSFEKFAEWGMIK